jgi:hypothetical protein
VTLDTLCTQLCTHIYPACTGWTLPVVCGVLPPSIGCTQQGCVPGAAGAQPAAAAAGMQPTPATRCFICPPLTQDCQPAAAAAAGMQPTPATRCYICPPYTQDCHARAAAAVQPTPTVQTHCYICVPHQTLDTLCTMPPGCPQFSAHICPTPSAVQQCGGPGVTFVGCTPQCPGVGHTLATLCTHPGYCPTQAYVCPPGRGGVFTPYGG